MQIGVGNQHTCVLHNTDEVLCFGKGLDGQIGNNSYEAATTPTQPQELGAVNQLWVGQNLSCARRMAGQVLCWGKDFYGASCASNGGFVHLCTHRTPRLAPQLTHLESQHLVFGRSRRSQDDAFSRLGLALLPNGQVAGFGVQEENFSYNMGGVQRYQAIPGLAGGVAGATGRQHSCVRLDSGQVRCWGHGELGQTGSGRSWSAQESLHLNFIPMLVAEIDNATDLDASDDSTCAVQANGSLWCWGKLNHPRPEGWVAPTYVQGLDE